MFSIPLLCTVSDPTVARVPPFQFITLLDLTNSEPLSVPPLKCSA